MGVSAVRYAVDIGGTFTDSVVLSPEGEISSVKTLSTSGQQAQSVVATIEELGLDVPLLEHFVHGTTVGLNALLERRGPRLALVVTRGFRDVYEIGRGSRPEMYNVHYQRPQRFLRRRDIFEIDGRFLADGTEVEPVDEEAVRALAKDLTDNYDSVAVSLLHSYRWINHEVRVKQLLEETLTGISVVASHEIAPEWREYERTSTTVISAYITPATQNYLTSLEKNLTKRGLTSPIHIMQSNGGITTAHSAVNNAIQTLYSGPVGGAIACETISGELQLDKLICVDMGGTSFDVSLVIDSRAEVLSQTEIDGHPILSPAVAIHSLGAGGGSIIRAESGGLRVGPESAGAQPGPACYGAGGVEPTVTDANVLLRRIPPGLRLGGTIEVSREAAMEALDGVGSELGLTSDELAKGSIDVVNAMMANGIREVTIARGIDPRDFVLLAFGGAGPLHATFLAEELEIDTVVIPASPGVLSAFGMLGADVRHDLVRSVYGVLEVDSGRHVEQQFTILETEALATIAGDGIDPDDAVIDRSLEMRYVGQEYALVIPAPDDLDIEGVEQLKDRFHDQYLGIYGHNNQQERVEFTSTRVTVSKRAGELRQVPRTQLGFPDPSSVWPIDLGGGYEPTPIYDRAAMSPGNQLAGPGVVWESGCTVVIPSGWTMEVSSWEHLILRKQK